MSRLRPVVLAALALNLAACAAPVPIRHYTLQPPAVIAGEEALPGFVLKDVRVPAHVDVVPLMVRRGDAALAVMEGHQWASPLKLEWRGALGLALRRAGAGPDLARSGLAPDPAVPMLQVDVQQFDTLPGDMVQASGIWSLLRDAAGELPAVALVCRFNLQAPAAAEPADWVRAHQQLVTRLAAQMVGVMQRLQTRDTANCPN